MILYLDTSSLVKLYVDEPGSEEVRAWANDAQFLATSVVAYPEMMSAVARKRREGLFSEEEVKAISSFFDDDWDDFATVTVDERAAGQLAMKHGLRAFDAVHLEAAIRVSTSAQDLATAFSSFDRRLNSAARAEGLAILAPAEFIPEG